MEKKNQTNSPSRDIFLAHEPKEHQSISSSCLKTKFPNFPMKERKKLH
jgi:hypothetical protein